jgi:tetratricopeptide (TPR) repeat protein
MDSSESLDFQNQLEIFLTLVGNQAFINQTPERFSRWFRVVLPETVPFLLEQLPPDPEEIDIFLATAATALYADLPTPANGLYAQIKPRQAANESCACGSGKLRRNCCGSPSMPPLFGDINLLRYVLDAYPQARLKEVCTTQADINAVTDTAAQWIENGAALRVGALLEPYFLGTGPLSVELSPLFDQLMNAWQELGRDAKRKKLIQTLLQRGDPALQSDAWQRLTTMQADRGDYVSAWSSFAQARQANPNDPALSFLEVTILMSEKRIDEAKSRAAWWADFLVLQRDPELQRLVDNLKEIASDPHLGMMRIAASADTDLQRLYQLFTNAPAPALRHSFDLMTHQDDEGKDLHMATDFEPDASLLRLEVNWREVFYQTKPDLSRVQNHADDVWESAPQWLDLLQKNPDLWLSFDVLDDIVMALDTVLWAGVEQRLLVPIAERVAEQMRLTLEANTSANGPVQCPWMIAGHRPMLRSVAHLAFLCQEADNWERFMALAHWLVFELNPKDNHGLRGDLSCAYVRYERWHDVLALQAQYPDDTNPALKLNIVLATLGLGEQQKAAQLLYLAKIGHPILLKMLLQKTLPKAVKPDRDNGVLVGGRYEAWLYIKSMRQFWVQGNTLQWAREVFKPVKSKS